VVGLTAEAGHYGESAGALLLFATNVAAILATGIIVMALYRVHRLVPPASTVERERVNRRNAVLVVVAFVAVILVPLVGSTLKIGRDTSRENDVRNTSVAWADSVGWEVLRVQSDDTSVIVDFAGPPPIPEVDALAADLRAAGVDGAVSFNFFPRESISLDP
jgi:hypothetical protein